MRFSALVLSSLLLSGTFALGQTAFTPPAIYPAIPFMDNILTADVNHDGRADLVVYDRYGGGGNFLLYLNDGTGKFGSPVTIPNNNLGAITSAKIADVNGDGFPDIVALQGTSLVVYLNDGTGNFTATSQQTATGSNLVIGDVNHDGHLDVIVDQTTYTASPHQNTLMTFFGDGTGKFGPPVIQTGINLDMLSTLGDTNCAIDQIAGGNFYLDNQLSLFVTSHCDGGGGSQQSGTAFLAQGDGTGHFTFSPSSDLGGVAGFVTTIDGNPNGRPNVVYAIASVSSYINLILATNNGGGNFTYSQIDVNGKADTYQGLTVADFNGDGIPDIATTLDGVEYSSDTPPGPSLVNIQYGTPSGSYTAAQSISIGGQYSGIRGIAAADFNGDGRADFAPLVIDESGLSFSTFTTQLYVYTNSTTCTVPTTANSNLICTPSKGATTTSPITVTAASNVIGFTLNRLYLDNTSVYQVASQMVNTSITAANGTHNLVLVSYNNAGKAFTTSTTFTVGTSTPPPPGGCLPTAAGVSICAPAAGSTDASPVTITAGAMAQSGNITAIRAYIDNVAVFTTNNPTAAKSQEASQSVTVAAGIHKLVVVGYESTGAALSSTESFTIAGTAPCYPSSAGAQICSPAQNAIASSPVTVVAGATAGSGYITAVRVYVDSVAKALVNNPQKSKSFAINTQVTIAAGKHSIVVVGYQSTGGSVSASDSVTVQ